MKSFHVLTVAMALLLALPGVRPAAGNAGADDFTEMSLEQLMAIPVYSASKREQKTTEAPSSVTVITSQEIRSYGWRTLGDLLRSVPGFYVIYPRTYGFVGIRGFGRPGDYGGRMLLLVNGHRMNDPLYDSAAVMEDFIVDMDLIDRVEIVRGPGSALYGNNAFFAVVNVITKRADQIGSGEAAGEVGSYDSYRGRLTYGAKTTNGTEALVSASGFRSEGVSSSRYRPNDADADDIIRNGDGESASRLHGSMQQGGLTVEGFYVRRNKDAPPNYGTVADLPLESFDGCGFVEGRYKLPVSENLSMMARLYYDWYEYWGTYPYDYAEPGQPRDLVINRDESFTESVGSELQLNWCPNLQHTLALGVEYRYDCRVSPRTDYLDIDPDTQIVGLYAQDEYRPLTNLAFTAGLRYDHDDTFGSTVNPRLASVYSPRDSTTLKFLYGTAFRAPNVNELSYDDNGQRSKGNPNLKPEKIATYEVICEQRLGHNWRISVVGFYNDVSDLINCVQDPEDGLLYSDNIDKVKACGVESHVEWQMTKNILSRASYTFTKTEDNVTDEPLNNSPEHLGKLNLTVPVFRNWLFAGGEAQYMSERTTVGGQTLDDVWLFNATVYSRRFKDRWEVAVSVYNVFDTHYSDPSYGDLNSVEQDGRTLRLKVSRQF